MILLSNYNDKMFFFFLKLLLIYEISINIRYVIIHDQILFSIIFFIIPYLIIIKLNKKNLSNYETDSIERHYKLSIFIPYLDSLISSLLRRFSSANKTAFSISLLHPTNMKKYTINIANIILRFFKYSIFLYHCSC